MQTGPSYTYNMPTQGRRQGVCLGGGGKKLQKFLATLPPPPPPGAATVPTDSRVSGRFGDTHFHAQKRINLVPEIRIFTLKSNQARSGAPHFSRSGRLKLVPEPHNFTLDRELVPEPLPIFHFAAAHCLPKFGVRTPTPPPPPPPGKWHMTSFTIHISVWLLGQIRWGLRICTESYKYSQFLIIWFFRFHKRFFRNWYPNARLYYLLGQSVCTPRSTHQRLQSFISFIKLDVRISSFTVATIFPILFHTTSNFFQKK